MTEYEELSIALQRRQLEETILISKKLDGLQKHLENNGFGYNAMVTIEQATEALNGLAGTMQRQMRN